MEKINKNLEKLSGRELDALQEKIEDLKERRREKFCLMKIIFKSKTPSYKVIIRYDREPELYETIQGIIGMQIITGFSFVILSREKSHWDESDYYLNCYRVDFIKSVGHIDEIPIRKKVFEFYKKVEAGEYEEEPRKLKTSS